MATLSSSERRWIASFLVVNVAFWIVLLGSLAKHPDDFFEAVNLAPAFFYAPFTLIAAALPLNVQFGDYPLTVLTVPIVGILCHTGIGYLLGRFGGKETPKWYISIPLALLIALIISFTAVRAATITGLIS